MSNSPIGIISPVYMDRAGRVLLFKHIRNHSKINAATPLEISVYPNGDILIRKMGGK